MPQFADINNRVRVAMFAAQLQDPTLSKREAAQLWVEGKLPTIPGEPVVAFLEPVGPFGPHLPPRRPNLSVSH